MIRWLVTIMLFGLAGLFAIAFHQRYWRWRDCFNELGRCFDPETQEVLLEQAGIAWGSLAVLCLAAGLVLLAVRRG